MTQCPVCSQHLEPPLPLAEMCPAQHGVHLSGARLAHALPARGLALLHHALSRPGTRACPGCCTTMERRLVTLPSGEEMDVEACASCGGHWFDTDELVRLTDAVRRRTRGPGPTSPRAVAPLTPTAALVEAFLWSLAGRA